MSKSLRLNETFSSTDLALSSALLCVGHRILRIDKDSPKSSFIFDRTGELERDVDIYWDGKLQVEAKRYFSCLKEIKSRLYGN